MELSLNSREHGLKLLVLVFEITEILSFLDKIFVHLNEIIIDPHLLVKLSPEACDHQQTF